MPSGSVERMAAELRGGVVGATKRRGSMQVTCTGSMRPRNGDAVQAAEAPLGGVVQAGQHLGGDKGLAVAGVVDEAGRDVDRVAEAVAIELDHLATGQCHLQRAWPAGLG